MNLRYEFPLDRPMKIEDHWSVPLLGGTFRLVEENGLVTAVVFEKTGMPTDISFRIEGTPGNASVATIHGRDTFLPLVRDHIKRAFSYLQCFFDTAISVDEVKVSYDAESEDEHDQIDITRMHIGKQERKPLPLTYDFMTRALMAAEDKEGPEFISSLTTMAREAFSRKRYIDSFRFSFLLIEAIYGNGKFKSKQLEEAFLTSEELVTEIEKVTAEWVPSKVKHASETQALMATRPSTPTVVQHLIFMRGHYFHGNINKKAAWHPSKQDEAEALAWLGIDIAQKISSDAALPMFAPKYAKRHFEEAGAVGAHVVMKIEYKFRVPEDDFIRKRDVNFKMPGTKPTTLMAMEAAFRSVQNFRNQFPVGRLHSVSGCDLADDKQIFHIRFFTEDDGTEVTN